MVTWTVFRLNSVPRFDLVLRGDLRDSRDDPGSVESLTGTILRTSPLSPLFCVFLSFYLESPSTSHCVRQGTGERDDFYLRSDLCKLFYGYWDWSLNSLLRKSIFTNLSSHLLNQDYSPLY